MNIWTQLLSLDGYPLDAEPGRSSADLAGASQPQAPAQHDRREETEAARRAIPLWRPAPGIAIR